MQRQKRLAADRFAVLRQLVEAEGEPEEAEARSASNEAAGPAAAAAGHHPASPEPKRPQTSRLASQLQVPEVCAKLPAHAWATSAAACTACRLFPAPPR